MEAEKKRLCDKLFMAAGSSSFKETLRGQQVHWLQCYRKLPKVVNAFNSGEPSVLVNICQNPNKVPVAGVYCPALLRGSKLWLLLPPPKTEEDEARAGLMERPLLPAEHLQLMGVPMYPEFAGDGEFPHISCSVTATGQRSLAGNASGQQTALIILSAVHSDSAVQCHDFYEQESLESLDGNACHQENQSSSSNFITSGTSHKPI